MVLVKNTIIIFLKILIKKVLTPFLVGHIFCTGYFKYFLDHLEAHEIRSPRKKMSWEFNFKAFSSLILIRISIELQFTWCQK